MTISRRSLIKRGLVAGLAGATGLPFAASSKRDWRKSRSGKGRGRDEHEDDVGSADSATVSSDGKGLFFGYEPFTQKLVLPKVLKPLEGDHRLDPQPAAYPRSGGTGREPVSYTHLTLPTKA